jgi:phospholipid/cholesterol/gamma-HCH transport system substrate-binding protein
MTDRRQMWLGLLILVSLGTLGIYTLFGSDLNLFGQKLYLDAEFPVAKGLRKGDSVMLAGTRVGRVTEVSFRPEAEDHRRILVRMRIDERIALREGYQVLIRDATLLGGRLVAIEPGPFGARELALSDGTLLDGEVPPDIFQALEKLGDVFSSSGDSLTTTFENIEQITSELREGDAAGNANRAFEKFAEAGDALSRIGTRIEEGGGSLGLLYTDPTLVETWVRTGENADAVFREAREGQGLVGRLLSDVELANRGRRAIEEIEAAAANLRQLTDGVAENGSLIGRAFRDEQLGTDFAKIGSDLAAFSDRLAKGEGTLARLIDSSELYDTVQRVASNLDQATSHVVSGKGTLGRILMRDDIGDELFLALRTANRSLEDYREAAPVTTFTSLIFSGF